ncbi:PrsW family intramembrane metalloprotease [Brachybacterium sp. p3-SID1565]|uniref:PrsW family intramembrane metalloprotease n=1 Tax=Brachybacterium sp. p3-SID1565 TaxID=2916046 RepID=UPI0021A6DFC2|nr:PrsW family intramembrane metalloprotease [Brachybacterium sp. p3-SID1565]MCT1385704.1 PrsW family intramembrane metalloprotease [Brachybacterium sp. p3-SID1565]
MSQPPPSSQGQYMSNGRPRPGAASPPSGAPSFQSQPHYRDYGNPKAYDTSVRPTHGLTAARYAPAQIQRPDQAQPQSAWATQTRRVQEVSQHAKEVPVVSIATWLALIGMGLFTIIVLGAFFLSFVMNASSSPIWWPVTAFLAGISLLVIFGVILLADRWDPQPIPLLLIAVLWGAAVAAGSSFLLNSINGRIFYAVGGEGFATWAGPVISAPLVEETTKGLGLIVLMLLARRYFNGPLDGMIYGALIGGGFAFTENIIYYTRILEGAGAFGVVILFVMRGVLNIFGHAIYTSLTGVIMGYVVRKWGTIIGLLSFLVATWPGMFLHAVWNLFAAFEGLPVMIAMFAVKAFISLLWLIFIVVLIWDEARLTRVRLGDYANQGWLTHEEVDMLGTWKGRREAKNWAAQMNAKPLMKKFIRDSADLASVRQRLLADGANPKVVELEARLLSKLRSNREALLAAAR